MSRFTYLKMLFCWPFLFDLFNFPLLAADYYLMSQFDYCVPRQFLPFWIFVSGLYLGTIFFLSWLAYLIIATINFSCFQLILHSNFQGVIITPLVGLIWLLTVEYFLGSYFNSKKKFRELFFRSKSDPRYWGVKMTPKKELSCT